MSVYLSAISLVVYGRALIAVPHNDYERVFKAIILAISGHQAVYGHEI